MEQGKISYENEKRKADEYNKALRFNITADGFVSNNCLLYTSTQKMFYVQTGNSAVDSIINTKQKIAEDKGIIFSSNISLPA